MVFAAYGFISLPLHSLPGSFLSFEVGCAKGTLECGIRQPTDSYRLSSSFQGATRIFMLSGCTSWREVVGMQDGRLNARHTTEIGFPLPCAASRGGHVRIDSGRGSVPSAARTWTLRRQAGVMGSSAQQTAWGCTLSNFCLARHSSRVARIGTRWATSHDNLNPPSNLQHDRD